MSAIRKELEFPAPPEGWEIEVTATSGLGVGVELVEWDRVEWSWGHDPSAPLAENILRAVAWAKEQAT